MSLDVTLEFLGHVGRSGSGIFVRQNGRTHEISRAEWDEKFPDREPFVLSCDDGAVYSGNITHNLTTMAAAACCYRHLWRPEEVGVVHAADLIDPLTSALKTLRADPGKYKAFNPENGWGNYDGLVAFVAEYLAACIRFPAAVVSVSR